MDRYILLDSWWYYQGVGGGVTEWIGRPDIFPQGNDYLRNKTGWPIMGHNRSDFGLKFETIFDDL